MSLDLIKIIVISLTGVINIFLGILVLARNPKNIINELFFLIGLCFGVWVFCLLFYEFPPIFDHIFWIKATYVTVSMLEVIILAFSFVFPKPIFQKAWFVGVIFSLAFQGLTSYLLFFANDWVLDVVVDPGKGLQTILGDGYIIWSVAVWLVLFWAVVNFIFNMRRSKGKEKAQILYLLIGFCFFGVFTTVSDIFYPIIFKDTKFFSISTIASLAFTFTATYVIVKHRFLEIRFVVARSIAYLILVSILGVFYTGGLFLVSTVFIQQETDVTNLTISTILALFMAFTFQPLKNILENFTDAVFYQGHYHSDQLLTNIGSIMSTNIELQSLAAQIMQELLEQMRISKGAIIILGEGLTSVYDTTEIGFSYKVVLTYIQISAILSYPRILIFEELEEGYLKNLMREMEVSVIQVLKVQDEVVGLLLLGDKSSGGVYSNQDLRVLEILAPEMSIAIHNSEAYDKIKKFNITLSDEVKKATSELQDANNRLQVLDKVKDDFVSIASHELRTPMTAIRSYAWMALHRSDVPLSKNLEKYITRILLSTERLINLVNDMLNVSRIESEKIEINPEPVDLLLLVKDIIDEVYYSKSEEKHIDFAVFEKPIPKAFADPEKLRQVFLNLVGNSLKFTPHGGKITFDFFSDGKTVDVSVIDTGVGIPKDDLGKLFSKFGRLDNSYSASATSGGTGLGLYISKNLTELMHGKIWAKSEGAGKGAAFTVALPIATPEVLKNIDQFRVIPKNGAKKLEPVVV